MRATRLIITADTPGWAQTAAVSLCGFATSVIACGCEAAIERDLPASETPDGRPGIAVLMFSMSLADLQKQVRDRVGQSVLTTAGSACYSGIDGEEAVKIGGALRYFGDGFQIAKKVGDRRFWRIPVMDGEFVCDDRAGVVKAVGGGNILIVATSRAAALEAAERAVAAMRKLRDVILPFPGGIVRSGSKVGSKYKALVASTNDAYCPTLKGQTATALPPEAASVLEIVIDGLTPESRASGYARRYRCRLRRWRCRRHHQHQRRQLRRQAGQVPIPLAGDHGLSGLTFRLKAAPSWRLDMSPLTPDRLAGLSSRDIGRIGLLSGNSRIPAGDLFDVTTGDPADIRVQSDSDKLDFIGGGMDRGRLTVEGSAGAYCGLNLAGGELILRGQAGPYAAAGMTGGSFEATGDVGDNFGSALPGEMRGMSGGIAILRGNAGQRIGDRMRRGTIIVEGNVGAYAASRMIAGTIIALGATVGAYPGFAMKRGTLILRAAANQMLPTFADCGRHELGFLNLLFLQLRNTSSQLDQLAAQTKIVQRMVGDQAAGGKGELLFWRD